MSEDLQPLDPEQGVEDFLEHRKASVSTSTFRNNKTVMSIFLDWCEEQEIDNLNELTGRSLARFVSWRRRQVKPVTLQKNLSSIREALGYWADIEAVEDGLREKVHAPELPDGSESRSVTIEPDRMHSILKYLDQYEYASRRHVIMLLLWRTGIRRGALRSIDLDDLRPAEEAIELHHRPEEGTPLKNKDQSERWIWLGSITYSVIEDYVDDQRIEVEDDYGREPLITTQYGRPAGTTIMDIVYRSTHPCLMGGCPHDREPETCEAVGTGTPSKCPSTRSPHAIRRGAITYHLTDGVPVDVVSERMDVSIDVLYKHYDARSQRERMNVRKQHLNDR